MSWWKKLWKAIKELWEKENEPNPDEPSEPDDGTFPDGIDLEDIKWLGPNISGWEKKYNLAVRLDGNTIVYDQEGTANWPVKMVSSVPEDEEIEDVVDDEVVKIKATALVGNPWIIAKLNGQWTAATHEWLRPNQRGKAKRSVHGDHIKRGEFGLNWVPTVGEEYGFCVSALARGGQTNVSERTQIVLFTWE